jgi:PRTRC genetic system protein C
MEQATEILSMKEIKIRRIFKWNDRVLTDPDPAMNAKEVIEFYSMQYPELIAGKIKSETPDYEKGTITFVVKTEFGTNG